MSQSQVASNFTSGFNFKNIIRAFTPAWHTINMGTGIISLLFHTFPYGQTHVWQVIALSFHILNLILFAIITGCSFARYLMFPSLWVVMLNHPVQSLYVGAFPMGLSTLISASVLIVYEYFKFGGVTFLYVLWSFWWIDVVLSITIFFGQLHVMFTRHEHSIDVMNSVWLLPVVTCTVASSVGGVVAISLQSLELSYAIYTMLICFWLVIIGVVVSMMILTIYLHRLVLYGLPRGVTVFSVFLPLGPMGQAGYAFLLLGQLCQDALPRQKLLFLENEAAPQTLNVICLCISFCLWSLATMWLILAIGAFLETIMKTKLWFKITFWGTIFPNGVYANLTLKIAIIFDSRFFRIWGSVYACLTLVLWIIAVIQTVPAVWRGDIFRPPSLEERDLIVPVLPIIRSN